jgi:hypothetical protein
MRASPWLLATLLPALVPCSACTYLADRALDFADQFRFTIGAGTVAGVRARAGGTVETGLMFGIKPRAAALGWRYGAPLYFSEGDRRFDADQAELIRTTTLIGEDFTDASYTSARHSFFLLPALFTWVDRTPTDYEWQVPDTGDRYEESHWLWSRQGLHDNRYQAIHAFDVEGEVGLFVYVSVGYSPGELLDFLLGFFFIDIAGDDGRIRL